MFLKTTFVGQQDNKCILIGRQKALIETVSNPDYYDGSGSAIEIRILIRLLVCTDNYRQNDEENRKTGELNHNPTGSNPSILPNLYQFLQLKIKIMNVIH